MEKYHLYQVQKNNSNRMVPYMFFFLKKKPPLYNETARMESVRRYGCPIWFQWCIDKNVKYDPEFYAQLDKHVENSLHPMDISYLSEWKLRA